MSAPSRRHLLALGLAASAASMGRRVLAQGTQPRVVALTARRFRYEPAEIELRVGERVVVEIRSLDFVHGMNIPELGRRLDLMPGQVTRLELESKAPGVIDFVCDNFCGDGHEEMHGRFVVKA